MPAPHFVCVQPWQWLIDDWVDDSMILESLHSPPGHVTNIKHTYLCHFASVVHSIWPCLAQKPDEHALNEIRKWHFVHMFTIKHLQHCSMVSHNSSQCICIPLKLALLVASPDSTDLPHCTCWVPMNVYALEGELLLMTAWYLAW